MIDAGRIEAARKAVEEAKRLRHMPWDDTPGILDKLIEAVERLIAAQR